jgi:SAM-dependent methyltransferase
MIEVAAAIGRPRGAPIEWRQADAVSLPFPDRSYDVVVCQMGLMFIEDAAAAVEEMHRVLKPGGRVVLNTPGRIQGLFEQMERAIVEHIDPGLGVFIETVFSMSEPEALGELLIGAGFDEVETTEYEARFDLPSPAEFLWQYINLTPMAPVVAAAPDASRVAMEDQVVETCAPWVEEGRVPLDQPMVLASGRRA